MKKCHINSSYNTNSLFAIYGTVQLLWDLRRYYFRPKTQFQMVCCIWSKPDVQIMNKSASMQRLEQRSANHGLQVKLATQSHPFCIGLDLGGEASHLAHCGEWWICPPGLTKSLCAGTPQVWTGTSALPHLEHSEPGGRPHLPSWALYSHFLFSSDMKSSPNVMTLSQKGCQPLV